MIIDYLHVSIAEQTLYAFASRQLVRCYTVSSALNGPSELNGSGGTPRGKHYVRAKIGAGLPLGAVLRGRRWTGEVWSPSLQQAQPERDWILSRILWLSGCELQRNRLGDCDTFRRYIYIHGTADEHLLGQPYSHGCIRMHNTDIIELYDHLADACPVDISEYTTEADILRSHSIKD